MPYSLRPLVALKSVSSWSYTITPVNNFPLYIVLTISPSKISFFGVELSNLPVDCMRITSLCFLHTLLALGSATLLSGSIKSKYSSSTCHLSIFHIDFVFLSHTLNFGIIPLPPHPQTFYLLHIPDVLLVRMQNSIQSLSSLTFKNKMIFLDNFFFTFLYSLESTRILVSSSRTTKYLSAFFDTATTSLSITL
ncbi:hypothetical protein SPJ1_0228 [Streptococcus parauberis KRS-02083]|uniref:Uncharacterized protein n=1 Tax=Streptococcus parauberis KRS-02083 TaxID=1207545 RepID=A0ABN0ITN6_9STRE|nr:hypothetical protein SPJ1_0228 [Streptococcus parauberis KRS-02083]QBX18112.1 hypothetical protein Javan393_0032 [Streptococcus phage Javan393]